MKSIKSIDLFAGCGGLTLGFEMAGISCIACNEFDKHACATLRANKPSWNLIEGDICSISFKNFKGNADIVTGGFPCQSFSSAGKRLGLEDVRGTMFYQFARVVDEIRPKIAIGENVRGLLSHENGKTLEIMLSVLDSIGYRVAQPHLLKAVDYDVPQKRERLFIIAIRKDLNIEFTPPEKSSKKWTLQDALKSGDLFATDVLPSAGSNYPDSRKKVLDMVPPGGYWRDLPIDIQKSYMKACFHNKGGKTGIARRLSWNEPSLTLMCSPIQKQTERCHPDETRPLTIREYARIQTFPDDYTFCGSISSQYKQIGNAVPVNLAKAVGKSVLSAINMI